MGLFKSIGNGVGNKMREEMRTALLPGEEIVDSQCAACSRMGMSAAFGGTIFFTNMRIIFETNKVNSKLKEIVEIVNNSDVLEYCKADRVGIGEIIPLPGITKDKNVVIKTADSGYNYAPQDPAKMLEVLKSTCPHAAFGKKSGYINTMKSNFVGWKGSSEENVSPSKQAFSQQNTVAQPAPDPMEQVKRLKELLDIGIITQEEFEAKKRELLNL